MRPMTLKRKLTYGLLAACMAMCLLSACSGGKGRMVLPDGRDSLYSAAGVLDIYGAEPRRALQLIDTLEAIGKEPDFMCDYLRATVYGRSPLQKHDSVIAICTLLMEHDSLQTEDEASLARRQNVLSLMCTSYRMLRDYESWLSSNNALAEICRLTGDEVEALRTDAETGYILTAFGRREEGLELLDRTIAALNAPGSVNRLDACIIAIKRKINVLDENGQPEDIVPLAKTILSKTAHFRQHTADYADDSYRLPAASGHWMPYCDFTDAQAYAFLSNAYMGLANRDSCSYWLAEFEKMPYSRSYGGRRMIVPTRLGMGQYEAVTSICDEEEGRMGTDTVNANYSAILRYRARVAEGRQQPEKACGYWRRYAAMEKKLNEQLQAGTAHASAARFHAQEQQRKLEKQQAALRTTRVIMVAVIVIAVILILFTIRQVQLKRVMDRKNRVLAEQIAEVIRLKMPQAEAQEARSERTDMPSKSRAPKSAGRKPTAAELKQMSETELFAYVCSDIRDNRLYTDPGCDRQMLAERYGLTFVQIGAAFARGSKYGSVADFIRDCRLEYACTLLSDTEMKMNDVAREAGFSRVTTFNHDFKARYSLAPSEYRKQNNKTQV